MRFRPPSLKYKFIITLMGFTVLLSVSFGVIMANRLSQALWQQFYTRGENLMTTLKNDVEAWDRTSISDLEKLGSTWDFLKENVFPGELFYFQVVQNGSLNFMNPTNEDTLSLLVEPVGQRLEIRHLTLPSGARVVDFKQPIRCGSKSINDILEVLNVEEATVCNGPSYVRLGLSPVQVTQELGREVMLIALVSAGFILAGVLVAFGLYKMILGPVEVLTHSVKSFRHDRFVRAHVHSGDELETLGHEFNKMAATISEYEQHLERINQALYRASQVKSEFLAIMGHELKTPLHAIRGFSQLLLQGIDGPITPEQRQDLEAILSSGDHLLELIDNILRFSKVEAGEETLHVETVSAQRVVNEALHSVESLVRKRGLKLANEVPELPVRADATKLKQILINLLSNAIKYTPAGTIRVRARAVTGRVRFAVADTGPGIDPRQAERVFEPFTQLDSSTTRESPGIGLGLAIVKKYVEMHGGRVWFEPGHPRGTVFYFEVPACEDAEPGPANGRPTPLTEEKEEALRS